MVPPSNLAEVSFPFSLSLAFIFVPSRDKEELELLLEKVINPGSIVSS